MSRDSEVHFYAVGDVGPCRPDPDSMFQHVRAELQRADLAFCQLEPVLTTRGEPMPQARLAMRSAPLETARAIRNAGFHVVSFASNHCMDWGRIGLFDTLDALRANQLQPVGAGANLVEARRPVLVTINEQRIAVLAYCSILPQGFEAETNRPGAAPMRAWTKYEQIEHDQPGTPARVHTFAHRDDLAALVADIARVKADADCVIVSMHWGVHFVPGEIAQYQREVAYAAIDAGADLILGHHPHVLKGIEVYRGKAIFYSLGNFALEPPTAFAPNLRESRGFKEIESLTTGWDATDLLPPDTRCSALVKVVIDDAQVQLVALQPVYINRNAEPELLSVQDSRHGEIAQYVQWATESRGLRTVFVQRDNDLIVDCSR
jgi:Bacterial capsule synthesis protein PGA_cap